MQKKINEIQYLIYKNYEELQLNLVNSKNFNKIMPSNPNKLYKFPYNENKLLPLNYFGINPNNTIEPFRNVIEIPNKLESIPNINQLMKLWGKQIRKNKPLRRHYGQRKLLLTEMDFLNNHLSTENPSYLNIIIYIGAAPSNHLGLIKKLYPNLIFFLIDPNEFLITLEKNKNQYQSDINDSIIYLSTKENNVSEPTKYYKGKKFINYIENGQIIRKEKNKVKINWKNELNENIWEYNNNSIFIIEDYMTTELSNKLVEIIPKNSNVFIWNDVRSISEENKNVMPHDVINDTILFHEWMKELKQIKNIKAAMFKFRTYYADQEEIDKLNINKINNKLLEKSKLLGFDYINGINNYYFPFYDGLDRLQIWQKIYSTETRLWIYNFDKIINYDIKKRNSKLNYYNTIIRNFVKHKIIENDKNYYDDYADSSLELHILKDYIEGFYGKKYMKFLPTLLNEIGYYTNFIK